MYVMGNPLRDKAGALLAGLLVFGMSNKVLIVSPLSVNHAASFT
jgi:hypothetical protein